MPQRSQRTLGRLGIPYPTGKEDDEFFGAVDEIELRAPMLMERLIR